MNIKKLLIILLLGLLFLGGAAGGYFYFSKIFPKEKPPVAVKEGATTVPRTEDLFTLRIYYPVGNRLQMEERRIERKTTQGAMVQATIEEFLKGPAGGGVSSIPKDAKLLGLYRDAQNILYIDLSEEFRRNLQSDALAEYLLIKGLYESLISNAQNIEDIKILIEGRERETLGGHLFLSHPSKDVVSYEFE